MNKRKATNFDIGLTGGKGQSNKADAIDSNNLIADVQLTAPSSGPSWNEISNDNCRQHGAPSGFDYHHSEYFVSSFRNNHLGM